MKTPSSMHKQLADASLFNSQNIELDPLVSTVNQYQNNKKVNELKNPVVSRKYLTTDKGLIFVVFNRIKNRQHGKMLNIVKNADEIFLRVDNIYMPVTSKIIRHLKKTMQNQKNIIITIAENIPNDDEIKIKFSITLDRVDCATIVSLYQISIS